MYFSRPSSMLPSAPARAPLPRFALPGDAAIGTCGLRLMGDHGSLPVESGVPGAAANPYRAFAATLAAGIADIQRRLPLPEMLSGDACEVDAGSQRVLRVPA